MTAINTATRLADAKRARRAKRVARKHIRYQAHRLATVDERAIVNAYRLPNARAVKRALDRAFNAAVARAHRTVGTTPLAHALDTDAELAAALGIES